MMLHLIWYVWRSELEETLIEARIRGLLRIFIPRIRYCLFWLFIYTLFQFNLN